MTLKEIILTAIKSRGYTQISFSKELGISQPAFNDRINKGSMKVSTMLEMLDKLGYEVIIKDKRNSSKAGTMILDKVNEKE